MNSLSPELLSQLFAQESSDPFVVLLTLSHATFTDDVRLVNNSVDIVSRGKTYSTFPVRIKLPTDDGESTPEFGLEFDNVSLELINQIRSVTDAIGVKMELVLASMPDQVQIVLDELKLQSVSYNRSKITAKVILDNFLNTEMTSERYTPIIYPGLF